MQVRTLTPHDYGSLDGTAFHKKEGDVYELGDDLLAKQMIKDGKVEKVDLSAAEQAEAKEEAQAQARAKK